MPTAQVQALRTRIDHLVEIEAADDVHRPHSNGSPYHREPGCLRLYDLVNKGQEFDPIWQHPQVLAAVEQIIGRPFVLSALSYRDPRQHAGAQALHADWGSTRDDRGHVVNSLWLLDDMDEGNGCTRVVPGSHRRPHADLMAIKDRWAIQPDELRICAGAGTVIVYNALLWHGGTPNHSGAHRRMLHSYYCAAEYRQQLDQAEHLRVSTARRLDAAGLRLLGCA